MNYKCFFKKYSIFILMLTFLGSCTTIDLFEKNIQIPSQQWKYDYKATGSFEIKDTTAAYNIYIVLRHTDAYEYNNIWLNLGTQSPKDSMHFEKINILLGNDAKGWEGTGMNDIWEVRKPIYNKSVRFKKGGTYFFSIEQIMRDNPLKHIMSAGIRLEKVK